jgi:hypothetical protein
MQLIVAMFRAVTKLPGFVKLDINGNEVVERGIDAIRTIFNTHKKILGGDWCYGYFQIYFNL